MSQDRTIIEQIKQEAFKVKEAEGIPYQKALDVVAKRQGYQTWHEVNQKEKIPLKFTKDQIAAIRASILLFIGITRKSIINLENGSFKIIEKEEVPSQIKSAKTILQLLTKGKSITPQQEMDLMVTMKLAMVQAEINQDEEWQSSIDEVIDVLNGRDD